MMKSGDRIVHAATALFAAAALVIGSAADTQAANGLVDKAEAKCAQTLGKAAAKLAKTIAKSVGKCRENDISGKTPGSCPDSKGQAKIDKAAAKLESSAAKKCKSVCSVSQDVECIADSLCPPLGNAVPTPTAEACTAGAKGIFFDMRDLGFPGPFCEGVLGKQLAQPSDIGECVAELTDDPAGALLDAIYGSLGTSSVSPDAAKCLGSISKAAQKYSDAIYKGVVKCRAAVASGKLSADPATCRFDDPKIAAKIQKAEDKLRDTIDTKCTDAQIQELDLCGNGIGGTLDRDEAKTCLVDAVNEITDTTENPSLRAFSPVSLVEAAYPPSRGVCGDGIVNQIPNPFALLGEECDGADDAACPGKCLPPGDVFECTCATRALSRFFADGLTADLDSGWTGTSHDSGVADNAGYIVEMTNCDCDDLDESTCVGTSADSVCDLDGFQLPSCSWDPLSATRCDAHGNGNTVDEDKDCYICDQFSANAGAFCVNEGDCQAQCYDANGTPTGPCVDQNDCAAGEVCRGQCDRTPTCIILPNGAPLPISSGGTAVCVLTTFREDVFGTRNIVTGEHENFVQQFSKVHLGVTNSVPCPVCGGFCNGGPRKGEICEGTCSVSGDSCRFDIDCPSGETCTTASASCPGSFCNLSAVCGGGANPPDAGPNFGQPCRVEARTKLFGTTSNDCLPSSGKNISGQGLEINFFPSTSETVTLPAALNCTAPGFELYKCPCPPTAGGRQTQPNKCTAACNAGAEFGQGCANGAGLVNGIFTSCAGGPNAGRSCDEDADCPSSTCSVNPTHCIGGDPADEHKLCTTNADCGGGGTCADACPSGRCVPLCLASDDPAAPPNSKNNPEEGVCAAGPAFYHCSGEKDVFRTCTQSIAEAGCSAVCAATCTGGVPSGGSGAPCDPLTPCPSGEVCCGDCGVASTCEAGTDGKLGTSDDNPGAGICIADATNCFANDLFAEGGDIFNGLGDPTNTKTVSTYCIGATSNSAVNNTAGLGGPGRLRQFGVNLTNVEQIPAP